MYYQKRQKNQGTDLRKSRERYQNLLEEKKKNENILMKDTRTFQKMNKKKT